MDYLYVKSLVVLGRSEDVEKFLEAWEKANPDDPIQNWCKAMIDGDKDQADNIANQINTKSGGTPWDPQYADTEFEIVKALSNAISKN